MRNVLELIQNAIDRTWPQIRKATHSLADRRPWKFIFRNSEKGNVTVPLRHIYKGNGGPEPK